MQIALALYPGVSADECEAFTCVFDRLDGATLIGVGAQRGVIEGPGGGRRVDALFSEVAEPDIVLVPGGIGCARAATDEPLLEWLRAVSTRCTWLAASSTGTVVVAAAGLLSQHDAATHWLAGDLLTEHGSHPSSERVVEIGNVITCEGRITAMHVALLVTLRVAGADAVAVVRERLAAESAPSDTPPRWQRWWRRGARGGRREGP
jgi:transcriptional regulator GlxA family with amidase domain